MSSEYHISGEVVLDTDIDEARGISNVGLEIREDNPENIIAFLKSGLPLERGGTLSVRGEIDRIHLVAGCLHWNEKVLALKEKYQSQIDAIYAKEDRLQEEELVRRGYATWDEIPSDHERDEITDKASEAVDALIDEFYVEYCQIGEG